VHAITPDKVPKLDKKVELREMLPALEEASKKRDDEPEPQDSSPVKKPSHALNVEQSGDHHVRVLNQKASHRHPADAQKRQMREHTLHDEKTEKQHRSLPDSAEVSFTDTEGDVSTIKLAGSSLQWWSGGRCLVPKLTEIVFRLANGVPALAEAHIGGLLSRLTDPPPGPRQDAMLTKLASMASKANVSVKGFIDHQALHEVSEVASEKQPVHMKKKDNVDKKLKHQSQALHEVSPEKQPLHRKKKENMDKKLRHQSQAIHKVSAKVMELKTQIEEERRMEKSLKNQINQMEKQQNRRVAKVKATKRVEETARRDAADQKAKADEAIRLKAEQAKRKAEQKARQEAAAKKKENG
jgi:hypothetical protein